MVYNIYIIVHLNIFNRNKTILRKFNLSIFVVGMCKKFQVEF